MSKAMSLKAKIRNIAKKKNIPAQVILQNYMIERLLVRLSASEYKEKFVLKGGMLVAAIVGLDNRATIQKALIEERVVQACSELLTEEKVKYIADQVYAACKNDGDLLSVKRLKAALKEADSAIENLWVALEKGQSVDMITERIHKREAEKKELEKQLAIEIKKQSGMEYSVILSFLDYLRMLRNDNEYKRRALVNIFINAIYLYDGYFTMILNAGNRPLSVENIPLDDIEKTFENDDVGYSSNSQLVADAPPK